MLNVRIQTQDFNIDKEYINLHINNEIGAIVTFCGLVRDFYETITNHKEKVKNIYLECYYDMANKVLHQLLVEAKNKFNIISSTIIHRIGLLTEGEKIVFIGVSAHHRKEAFLACEFLIDYLKSQAPFWKKEISPTDSFWVKPNIPSI